MATVIQDLSASLQAKHADISGVTAYEWTPEAFIQQDWLPLVFHEISNVVTPTFVAPSTDLSVVVQVYGFTETEEKAAYAPTAGSSQLDAAAALYDQWLTHYVEYPHLGNSSNRNGLSALRAQLELQGSRFGVFDRAKLDGVEEVFFGFIATLLISIRLFG